ncbi:hypothetical protein V8G54_023244, partial [Vigna mungo]
MGGRKNLLFMPAFVKDICTYQCSQFATHFILSLILLSNKISHPNGHFCSFYRTSYNLVCYDTAPILHGLNTCFLGSPHHESYHPLSNGQIPCPQGVNRKNLVKSHPKAP